MWKFKFSDQKFSLSMYLYQSCHPYGAPLVFKFLMSFSSQAEPVLPESAKLMSKMYELLNISDISQLELIPYDPDNISESEEGEVTPSVS